LKTEWDNVNLIKLAQSFANDELLNCNKPSGSIKCGGISNLSEELSAFSRKTAPWSQRT
jgi:hypothetical protein